MAGYLQHYLGLMNGWNDCKELNESDSNKHIDHIDLAEEVDVINVGDDNEDPFSSVSLKNGNSDLDNDDLLNLVCLKNGNYDLNKPPETVKPEHLIEIDTSDDDTNVCRKCLHQFNTKEKLNYHLDMHILYADNECSLCHKVFTLAKNLKRHLAWVHSVSSVRYYCLSCPKIFNHAEKIALHEKKCKLDKPVCYLCSQELETLQDLRVHQEYEHSLRGVLCGFCAASFPTAKELTAHVESGCRKMKVGKGSDMQNEEVSSEINLERPECAQKNFGTRVRKSLSTSKLKERSSKKSKMSKVGNVGYGHVLKSIMNYD